VLAPSGGLKWGVGIAVAVLVAVAVWWLGRTPPKSGVDPVRTSEPTSTAPPPPASTPTSPPRTTVEPTAPTTTSAPPATTSATAPVLPATASGAPSAGKPDHAPTGKPIDDESVPLNTRVMRALEANQTAKAVQLATQLTNKSPGSATAWQLRGAAEQAAGRGGKASFQRCAELAPPDSPLASECKSLAGM
jgi:hypothetical protein